MDEMAKFHRKKNERGIEIGKISFYGEIKRIYFAESLAETIKSKPSDQPAPKQGTHIQGDQLYMAVCLWYLVKRDLSSVHYGTVSTT